MYRPTLMAVVSVRWWSGTRAKLHLDSGLSPGKPDETSPVRLSDFLTPPCFESHLQPHSYHLPLDSHLKLPTLTVRTVAGCGYDEGIPPPH